MGILDLFKSKKVEKKKDLNILSGSGLVEYIRSNLKEPTNENVLKALDKITKPDEDLEHLTPEGEFPWGWHSQNKDFTSKIESEFSYFLNVWLDAKNKSPKEQHSALKSFVLYLEDVEKLCKSKSECFEFWFYNILITPDYLETRKKELKDLVDNLEELQEIYEKKQNLFPAVIELLKANDGILQSDFKKLFDEPFQNEVADILYHLHKEGKLEKIKEGRTYILHLRG